MKKINDISIIDNYYVYHQNYLQSCGGYHLRNDEIGDPPEVLQNIFTEGGVLTPQDLSFDLAKRVFIQDCESMCKDFVIDHNNSDFINELIRYATQDPASKCSFKKGLMIIGGVGSGKTVLIRSFGRFMRRFSLDRHYVDKVNQFNIYYITSYDIAERYSINGPSIFEDITELKYKPLIIDDIGTEPVVKHYGNEIDPLVQILFHRYNRCEYKTYVTTNLDGKDLKARYGTRIYSRMKEMFNDIILPGDDRRK